jgi:hypothetical protein
LSKLAGFIVTRSRLIIAIVGICNLAALLSITRIALNTDITSFFSEDNEVYDEYLALTEKYGISDSLTILIEDSTSLLTEESLLTVYDLRAEVEAISGIAEVQTFLPERMPVGGHMLVVDERFISVHSDVLEDYTRNHYAPATGMLSRDESTGLITLTLASGADAAEVVDKLKPIIARYPDVELSLAGDAVIGDTLEWYLIRILFLLPPATISLILLVFYGMLRNFRLSLLSLMPAGMGALWTLGTIFWQGQAVNLVTVVSPIFVIVMGSADGLHYTTHLLEKLSQFPDRRRVTEETMRMVLKPIFLTSVTTMAGFGSLAWTDLVPTRQMGIYVPLGIGYACILSVFFLPALLTHIPLPTNHEQKPGGVIEFFVNLPQHRNAIIVAAAVILGVSAYCLVDLKVVSDPLLYFRKDSGVRQTFQTIEDSFGGALVIVGDIAAPRGLDTLRDSGYAEDVLEMERELERVPGILSASSLFDVIQGAHTEATGRHEYPGSPAEVSLLFKTLDEDDFASWYRDDGLRLVARTADLTSEDVALLRDFVASHPELRTLSGTPMLYDELNRLTVQSQVRSLLMALVLVYLMLFVAFRSPRTAFYGLVPIMVTIVAVMGSLVITGFNLNVVTATLSAVTVGTGVDYAIHLISGIQYYRAQGMTTDESVRTALATVSRPVLASAFGLSVGISVMFLSPLHIHTEVASVMWVAMTVSSFGALSLIPLFYQSRRERGAPALNLRTPSSLPGVGA